MEMLTHMHVSILKISYQHLSFTSTSQCQFQCFLLPSILLVLLMKRFLVITSKNLYQLGLISLRMVELFSDDPNIPRAPAVQTSSNKSAFFKEYN